MRRVRAAIVPLSAWEGMIYPAPLPVSSGFAPVVDSSGTVLPLIHHWVREALVAGVERVVIVSTPELRPWIARYFSGPALWSDTSSNRPGRLPAELERMAEAVQVVVQEAPQGVGHAVLCARDAVPHEAICVWCRPRLFQADPEQPAALEQLIRWYEKLNQPVLGVQEWTATQRFSPEMLAWGSPQETTPGAFYLEALESYSSPEPPPARTPYRPLLPIGVAVLTPQVFDILDYNDRNDIRHEGKLRLLEAFETLSLLEGMVGGTVLCRVFDLSCPERWIEALCWRAFQGSQATAWKERILSALTEPKEKGSSRP